ncbi:MAG: efflux RND transporter permease subunit, partial [Caulobacteraceae bacterium]|nr:efflux RND transporter permease subunit [Caulobacteraceae bacterium]
MTGWLRGHARSIVFAFIVLTLAGIGAAARLPVALFPQIAFPRVVISVDAGERAADQTAVQITRPLEQALRGVPGVQDIRSTTSRGAADIALTFGWGHDMVSATLQSQAAINGILPDLPAGVRFDVRRMDPTVFPILGYALTGAPRDAARLRNFALLQIRPVIAATPGVAAVDVLGGAQEEYQVLIEPARLQALGLGMDDVVKALAAANTVAAAGRFEDRHKLYLTLTDTRLAGPDDIRAVPIKTAAAAPSPASGTPPASLAPPSAAGVVTLGQIAEVRLAPAQQWTRVTAQGRDAVLINVRQSPSADSVALARAIRAKLKSLHPPPGARLDTFYDQSQLVSGAAHGVRDAILIGALLAGAVLFAFLRSPRLMAITALMLPAVLATSCLILSVLGMSFNMMTLGGLAAAVGLVVDDAVVMLEHLMRRLEEAQAEGADDGSVGARVLGAAREMARPLIGSTGATLVVFAPLAFLSGVTGGFFKALAVTMTSALIISLLFTLFVAPVLARAWLRGKDVESARRAERLTGPLTRAYTRLATRGQARPGLVTLVVAAALLGAGGLSFMTLGSGFMPKMDEGGFVLDYKARPGSALGETDQALRRVEAIIRATPEVDSYSRRTGVQLGGGLTEADEGDFFIHLRPGPRRGVEAVMADIRRKVQASVAGLDIETAQLMEDLIGDLTAVPQPIEIKLFAADPAVLPQAARMVAPAIGRIPGVVEVVDGLRVAGDAVTIKVDRAAAALEGMDPGQVSSQADTLIEGAVATQIQQGETTYPVRVWTPATLRTGVEALGDLRLHAADGHEVPLSRVARIGIAPGQQQITRENLQPFVGVTARLEGRDLGSAMAQVKK